MEQSNGADAPKTTPTSEAGDGGSTDTISRAEAQKAFEARDRAKARASELEAKLAEIERATADAEKAKAERDGDLAKQIELRDKEMEKLRKELESRSTELGTIKAQARSSKIEQAILSEVARSEDHPAALAMLRGISAQLDDGTEDPGKVSEKALAKLRELAPGFFDKRQAPQSRGFMPPDQPARAPGAPQRDALADLQRINPSVKVLV